LIHVHDRLRMQVRVGGRTELTSIGGTGRRGVREHAVQGDPEVLPYQKRASGDQGTRRSHEDLENPESPRVQQMEKKTDGSRSDHLKTQTHLCTRC